MANSKAAGTLFRGSAAWLQILPKRTLAPVRTTRETQNVRHISPASQQADGVFYVGKSKHAVRSLPQYFDLAFEYQDPHNYPYANVTDGW